MIELTSLYNRVVCMYGKDPALTLIGARDLTSLQELMVKDIAFGLPVVKEYPLTTPAQIEQAAEQLNATEQEGFVCVDSQWNRVKIKSTKYVLLHHLKESLSLKNIVALVQKGETSEVIAYFENYAPIFYEVETKIGQLVAAVDNDYTQHKHFESQKDFAMAAITTQCPDALFTLRKGKTPSIQQYVMSMNPEKLLRLISPLTSVGAMQPELNLLVS